MKVKELIEKLKEFEEDAEVKVEGDHCCSILYDLERRIFRYNSITNELTIEYDQS